ncbi:aldo/keto reductase [Maridesulfovibrio sp.]|uniref:aldo/keto reductase n=1 Tax=Maridesulfovibrio sp. TaxID=2795000 RepID=UPI002A18985C|nr:aldo/keto reductase [Maridesulfovibrio sp.]
MPKDNEISAAKSIGTFNFKEKNVLLNSGYKMPIVGIGTYSLQDDVCVTSVIEHLKIGGRLIDTAFMYHNEKSVGKAVRLSGVPRDDIFVTTKLYPNQYGNAEAAIDEALQKLDIGYVDLMLLHHPGKDDVEAYKTMERAVEAGNIRSIGLSCYYIEELTEFLPKINIMPSLVQNEIHPYYQDIDVIPFIQSKGIVVQGWYPLGGRGYTAPLLDNQTISEIARTHNKTSAQVILRWNMEKEVIVIPGSSNPDHIKENLNIFDFSLSSEEMSMIKVLERKEKHDWY